MFFPPIHKTLNHNHVSIVLINLLFWVKGNPNPDAVAEPTLTCRDGANSTRQAATIPKTSQPVQLLHQPCHTALSSARLLHPPAYLLFALARTPARLPALSIVLPARLPVRLLCRPVLSIPQLQPWRVHNPMPAPWTSYIVNSQPLVPPSNSLQ